MHGDALSSTQLVTDENGNQVGRFIFGAWGEELYASESIPGLFDNRFVGGLGCRRDAATGLIYMRHRWYDGQLQRFISRDPIGLMGGANLYRYCGNQPTSKIDPSGLQYGGGEAYLYLNSYRKAGPPGTVVPWRRTFIASAMTSAAVSVAYQWTLGALTAAAATSSLAAVGAGILVIGGVGLGAYGIYSLYSQFKDGHCPTADEAAAISGGILGGGFANAAFKRMPFSYGAPFEDGQVWFHARNAEMATPQNSLISRENIL